MGIRQADDAEVAIRTVTLLARRRRLMGMLSRLTSFVLSNLVRVMRFLGRLGDGWSPNL